MKIFAAISLLLLFAIPFEVSAEEAKTPTTNTDKLIGDWQRTDGGYVLQVEAIDKDGKAKAKYLNPNPINVESATVSQEKGKATLFVVLRDTGYPGSTYTLHYQEADGKLTGIYFQAATKQSFQVEFVRM